ncbi:MAG: hypothetical protein DRJ38_10515 [Thermoprotei archaeon]|nr:MAG: hypothetical protein DRJ38_10515 [Thermoprotei archaeon]
MTRKASIIAFIALIIIAVASFCICHYEMQNALRFLSNVNLPSSPFNELYVKTVEFVAHVFNMTLILLFIAFIVALIVLALECSLTA